MKYYCPNCDKECATKIIEKNETLEVKGQEITLRIKMRVCEECGEDILDEILDNETLKMFYEEYKKRNNLLTAVEIRDIRTKWGLSQAQFALLLGMGEKTITRYERGSIQDETHDNLIRLAKDADSFKTIWDLRKKKLNKKTQSKVDGILKKERMNGFSITAKPMQEFQYMYPQIIPRNIIYGGQFNAGSKYSA